MRDNSLNFFQNISLYMESMKIYILPLLVLCVLTVANRPQLSLNIHNGNFKNIGGLNPCLSWSTSCAPCDIDLEYGIKASVFPTTDISSLPQNIWGKVSKSVSGWNLNARADISGTDFRNTGINFDAVNGENDISLHLEASTGDGINIKKFEAVKGFDVDGSRVIVKPRYNFDKDVADIVLAYNTCDTGLEVTVSQNEQSATLSHQLNDFNCITPTFTRNGDISLEWEHRLGVENSVKTLLKPNKSVDVEWRDSSWTANINLPIDGTSITGTNVSIKREVNF